MPEGRARYADRRDAGRALAAEVAGLGLVDPLVLALPRGGVPVAAEVAGALGCAFGVLVARKIGAPRSPELAVGAITEGGEPWLDEALLRRLGLSADDLADTVEQERAELARRVQHYRGDRPLPELFGRQVVLVDDGLATGATARSALRTLRRGQPARLVLAVPVCSSPSAQALMSEADDVVCALQPSGFRAVGEWYDRFEPTSDAEVLSLLRAAG